MVCFGAIIVDGDLDKTFYGQTKPISKFWKPEALSISGFTRDQHNKFNDPQQVMLEFDQWIKANSKGHPIFVSDNLAYDWQFINYYFHKYFIVFYDTKKFFDYKYIKTILFIDNIKLIIFM